MKQNEDSKNWTSERSAENKHNTGLPDENDK